MKLHAFKNGYAWMYVTIGDKTFLTTIGEGQLFWNHPEGWKIVHISRWAICQAAHHN